MDGIGVHTTAGKDRFVALDGMRGCLALTVAAYHFDEIGVRSVDDLMHGGYLAVDFFFVLSGFVIAHGYGTRLTRSGGVADFLARRVARLYPVHLVMILPYLAIETMRLVATMAGSGMEPRPPFTGWAGLPALFANLALVQSFGQFDVLTWNGPSWSIGCELWTYVIFALSTCGPARWRLPGQVAIVGVGFAALLALPVTDMNVSFDYGILRCLVGFFLGVLARELIFPAVSRLRLVGTVAGGLEVAALIAALGFALATSADRRSLAAPLVFLLPLVVFALEGGFVSRMLRGPLFAWLGRLSYSIYMVHAVLLYLAFTAAKKLGGHFGMELTRRMDGAGFGGVVLDLGSPWATAFAGLAFLAMVLAAAELLHRRIEVPGRRLVMRLWDRLRRDREIGLGRETTGLVEIPVAATLPSNIGDHRRHP